MRVQQAHSEGKGESGTSEHEAEETPSSAKPLVQQLLVQQTAYNGLRHSIQLQDALKQLRQHCEFADRSLSQSHEATLQKHKPRHLPSVAEGH